MGSHGHYHLFDGSGRTWGRHHQHALWRSQGVGYIYVAGGIPQIKMMTQTGAAEQHGHQTALTHLLLSSGASVRQQPPKAELPTMTTSPAEPRPARSAAGSTLPTRARVVAVSYT